MPQRVSTFLMFSGNAAEALDRYSVLFRDMEIVSIERQPSEGEDGAELVKQAHWRLADQNFMAIDSTVDHGFSFTPAMSIFFNCDDEDEIDRLFEGLSDGGQVLMPLDSYPFSQRFGWVEDRFGVSWQLNLP